VVNDVQAFSSVSLVDVNMVGQKPAQVKLHHSVKVPQFYKTAANIAKQASEEHRSLKDLVFNANKHLVSSALTLLTLVTALTF
jgi:hypothetical protein